MEFQTKAEFDLKLLQIVHSLQPFEEIKIKKDEFGKPNRIIVLSSTTTILDLSGHLTVVKK